MGAVRPPRLLRGTRTPVDAMSTGDGRKPNPARTLASLPKGAVIALAQHTHCADMAKTVCRTVISVDITLRGEKLAYAEARRMEWAPRFYMQKVWAQRGWGPLVYDILMERATQVGTGLSPDYSDVSDDARAVWRQYTKRADVTHVSAYVGEPQPREDEFPERHWAFRKKPTLLRELTGRHGVVYSGDWTSAKPGRKSNPVLDIDETMRRMKEAFARAPWFRGKPRWSYLEEGLRESDPESLAYVEEHLDEAKEKARVEASRQKAKAARAAEREEKRWESQGIDLSDVSYEGARRLAATARGKDVWLYHGTSSKLLPRIRKEGLRVGQKKVDPSETPGVYLTARAGGGMMTGGTASFYARRAAHAFGGDPVVLRVLVPFDSLEQDMDDEDISAGTYQFVTDYVSPEQIKEIDGVRVKGARKKNPAPRRARVTDAEVLAQLRAFERREAENDAEEIRVYHSYGLPTREEVRTRVAPAPSIETLDRLPDAWIDETNAVDEARKKLFHERWEYLKSVGWDPRTRKPKVKQKSQEVDVGESGHYPQLLLPTAILRTSCEGEVTVHDAPDHIRHTSCFGGTYHHFRYFLDGHAVAGLTLHAKKARAGRQTATIDMVYTEPSLRRHGYAKALLDAARDSFAVVSHSKTLTGEGRKWRRAVNPASAPIVLWHGSQHWDGPPSLRPSSMKNMEHGPGLYLTTSRATAARYAKGGGSLVRFELEPDLRWLQDSTVPTADALRFVRTTPKLRHRADIERDIRTATDRAVAHGKSGETLPAGVLLNLLHYYRTLTGDHGPALARFLTQHGVDAELVDKGDEDWVVLFNLDKIRSHRRVPAREAVDAPRLPRGSLTGMACVTWLRPVHPNAPHVRVVPNLGGIRVLELSDERPLDLSSGVLGEHLHRRCVPWEASSIFDDAPHPRGQVDAGKIVFHCLICPILDFSDHRRSRRVDIGNRNRLFPRCRNVSGDDRDNGSSALGFRHGA